jgi:pimeloyl-ACP methyl ester carboxylesterase
MNWEELSDVVLCGHSYAGCVITGVADQIPDRIRALVFLDAFLPENEESFMDIVPSEVAQAIRDQAKATGEGWKLNPIPAQLLGVRDRTTLRGLTHNALHRQIATFEERIKLTGNLEHIQDIAYVFPTACNPNLLVSHKRAKAKGWKMRTIDSSGHEFMIDHPQTLTKLLLGYQSA